MACLPKYCLDMSYCYYKRCPNRIIHLELICKLLNENDVRVAKVKHHQQMFLKLTPESHVGSYRIWKPLTCECIRFVARYLTLFRDKNFERYFWNSSTKHRFAMTWVFYNDNGSSLKDIFEINL